MKTESTEQRDRDAEFELLESNGWTYKGCDVWQQTATGLAFTRSAAIGIAKQNVAPTEAMEQRQHGDDYLTDPNAECAHCGCRHQDHRAADDACLSQRRGELYAATKFAPAPSRETPPPEPEGHAAGRMIEWGYDLNHTIAEMDGEEWGLTVCQIPGSGGIGKGRVMPEDAAHARLIVAACNSYRRHFGPHAVQAAEDDELGAALQEITAAEVEENHC